MYSITDASATNGGEHKNAAPRTGSVYTGIRSWYRSHDVDALSGYHQNRELRNVDGRLIYTASSDADWREIKTTWFEQALWNDYPA